MTTRTGCPRLSLAEPATHTHTHHTDTVYWPRLQLGVHRLAGPDFGIKVIEGAAVPAVHHVKGP